MIRLSDTERLALGKAAWARRRQSRELAELIVRHWLIREGYIDDPTAASELRTLEEDADSANVLPDGRAIG